MGYTVDLSQEGFTEEEFLDVKQCLETLLSIIAGTQPLDRDLGLDINGIAGFPLNTAKNLLSLEIIEKVKAYEPRAEVFAIDFTQDGNGQLAAQVHFVKAESR